MGDLLDEIIKFIIVGGQATAKDIDIFKEHAPLTPDNCTIIYEYAGSSPAPFTNTSVRSIQVVCRAKTSKEAKNKSWQLYSYLYRDDLFITLGIRKCLLSMRNTPIKIGVDEQERTLWAFNFALTTNFD